MRHDRVSFNLLFERKGWSKKRTAIFLFAVVLCISLALITRYVCRYNLPGGESRQLYHSDRYYHTCVANNITLGSGEYLEQHFTAGGNMLGEYKKVYLRVNMDETDFPVAVEVVATRDETGEVLSTAKAVLELSCAEKEKDGQDADLFSIPLQEYVVAHSGGDYCLRITNISEAEQLTLKTYECINSGNLICNGEEQPGILDFGFWRVANYEPSILVDVLIILTCITVITGLALVLFYDVPVHTLYLVLAIGFGIVTLFDVTPLYGFDMRFHFDSAYVLSNKLQGMEGVVNAPATADPKNKTIYYYRRTCDDYSTFQFYLTDSISDNYTDVWESVHNICTDEGDEELLLQETHLGGIGEQLYLYLPQTIGFVLARVLHLRFYPMLQLARLLTYGLFVLCTYHGIRNTPVGKRILLIIALTPGVLVQATSISRDAVILAMSYYLIGTVLGIAYSNKRIKGTDWLCIIGVSALLAPCKMIYLPISFFWLLIVYRRYLLDKRQMYGKPLALTLVGVSAIFLFFVLANIPSIISLSESEKISVTGDQAYSLAYLLTHFSRTIVVFLNTMRVELGQYLANAIQLEAIGLGSSDGIALLVTALLILESLNLHRDGVKTSFAERVFFLAVAVAVFLLVSLASMQWTSIDSFEIVELQGRYLLPVLPLLFMSFGNKYLCVDGKVKLLVSTCCCIYPAIALMNMYLWTILH